TDCFSKHIIANKEKFYMLTREDIFNHIKENYGTTPDLPFKKFPLYAALRHQPSRKWYGLIMNVSLQQLGLAGTEEVDVLNLKCRPELSGNLRDGETIIPAYHMDKEHWISIILDRIEPKTNEVYNLIEQSFHLTKKS